MAAQGLSEVAAVLTEHRVAVGAVEVGDAGDVVGRLAADAARGAGGCLGGGAEAESDGEDAGGQDGAGLAAHVCSLLFES